VDPCGDTTFNASQVSALTEELAFLAREGGDVAGQARSVLGFVASLPDRSHRYLKFIGD
jgi:hypothetical protein